MAYSKAHNSERKKIFVLGHDRDHQHDVTQIHGLDHIEILPLLDSQELINQDEYDIDALLGKARRELDRHNRVDGIVCHWDFPVTSMHSILCAEYQLPGPSLESLLKCAHKYWSRLEQRKIVPENTVDFCAVDPFNDNAFDYLELAMPFWVKPIKGYGSMLGFKIESRAQFEQAMADTRKVIRTLGDPFNRILDRVHLPEELDGIDGNWMLAEQYVGGKEFAPEGYVQNGHCHIHGMIDMVIGPNGKSFERYEYPSVVAESIQREATRITEQLMHQIGFDNGCFNVEYFWDADCEKLWIIEINPRISQSHSYLFEQVNGISNHEVAVKVALGETPDFDRDRGKFKRAAKYLHRRYDRTNMVATHVPSDAEVRAFNERLQPETVFKPRLREGMALAQLKEQDPYSYVVADVMIAADNRAELEQKYREVGQALRFEFAECDAEAESNTN